MGTSTKSLKPFLQLPFKKQKYRITEGWIYSKKEQKIHGFKGHGGIDFALPRGTPVLAAAGGWAIASYFGQYPLKREGKFIKYKGKPIGFGLGYFVQIFHPGKAMPIYTTYGHLARVDPKIKFHEPRRMGNHLWPVGHKIPPEKLPSYPKATFIKQGEVIGCVGDSGLEGDWDEVHLHFEVFTRVGHLKKKVYFDPYGIKSVAKDYPDPFKKSVRAGVQSLALWNFRY